jgi:acyl-CoA synthetase (NDP forming)
MEGREVGDAIRGSKIVAEARKVTDPVVVVKTGRHKAQRVVLSENVTTNFQYYILYYIINSRRI